MAPHLHCRRIGAVFALAAACVLKPVPSSAAHPGDPPPISSGSALLAEYAAMPVTRDVVGLIEAREVYRLAGRTDAAGAIGQYLERVALARVLETPEPAAATIADIVRNGSSGDAAAVRDARSKLLRTAVQLETMGFGGQTITVGTRNVTTRTVKSAFASLVLERSGKNDVTVGCTSAQVDGDHAVAPGKTHRYSCTVALEAREIEAVQRTARSGWRVELKHVQFEDPDVSVSREGIRWDLFEPEGIVRAHKRLRAASCEARGSCAREALERWLGNPFVLVPLLSLAAGVVVGLLFSLLPTRRMSSATWTSIILFIVGAFVLSHMVGPGWGLMLLVGAFEFVPLILVPYFFALMGALAVAQKWRPEASPAGTSAAVE